MLGVTFSTQDEQSTQHMKLPMCAGTTPGQDLNLSMERITANRNLTNKLWNAGKFIALQLEAAGEDEWAELAAVDLSEPEALAGLPLAERWVLSELHQVRGSAAPVQRLCDDDNIVLCSRRSCSLGTCRFPSSCVCLMINLLSGRMQEQCDQDSFKIGQLH